MEDISKIKERIAKLLRMAQDSSSPHEAAIAASRARSLMDKYQLSEVDIDGDVKEAFGTRDVYRDGKSKPYQAVPSYMSILSVSVARFNDCQAVYVRVIDQKTGRSGKVIRFRGFENDTALAVSMFESLMSNMSKLCKAYLLSRGITGRQPRDLDTAFKLGCASELGERLRALTKERNEMVVAENVGTALMVVKKNERVADHFGRVDYEARKTVQAYDSSTFDANESGRREGRKMQIQAGVNSGRDGYLEN